MIGKPFINEVLSNAIENYLKYKDKEENENFWTFPVVAVRTLVFIYGELDIINPFITQNEHNMGGFDSNLTKYGWNKKELEEFKNAFQNFKKEEEEGKFPNISFLIIEKALIKMFFCKQKAMNRLQEQEETFKKYIYLAENQNERMKKDREKYLKNPLELNQYYQSISYEYNHNYSLQEVRRSTLLPEAYMLLGYKMEQITLLNDIDLRKVNDQVYQFFRVNPNLNEKDELLRKGVNYYKKYGNKVTSGNGYVDFLLFASILATATMILAVIITKL